MVQSLIRHKGRIRFTCDQRDFCDVKILVKAIFSQIDGTEEWHHSPERDKPFGRMLLVNP